MSAAKMVADSTQSELADAMDGRKRKKKMKKTGKKVVLPEDEDSDLDLKKELKPVSAFVKDRPQMIEEMFRAVRGASLQRALPDLLKSIPIDELKQLCLEQLEVMSKKRIRRIMAGEESANISSSGTEDDTSDEEVAQPDDPSQQPKEGQTERDGHPADSTSVHQENNRNDQEGQAEVEPLVQVKQEPPDSGEEGDGEDQEEDEEEEEPPENYTSGSEDGELVRKEDQQTEDMQGVVVKQEPMSDDEQGEGDTKMEDDDGDNDANMEDIEGDLMASVQGGSEDGVLPSIMMDQMELLELEMRARAIKAMLSSHAEEGAHDDDEEGGGDDDDNEEGDGVEIDDEGDNDDNDKDDDIADDNDS